MPSTRTAVAALLTAATALASGLGCREEDRSATSLTSTSASSTSARGASGGAASSPAGAVTQIVFVDKQQCCACTQKRIDASWAALTEVLGSPPSIAVERIHMDSEAKRAAPYLARAKLMVPPGLYFLDAEGDLVKLLQGKVTPEQVTDVLGGAK
jgi:hypothetical protein